jgi:hypothetical protein
VTGLARWEVQPSKAFLKDFMDRTLQCLDDFRPQVRPCLGCVLSSRIETHTSHALIAGLRMFLFAPDDHH